MKKNIITGLTLAAAIGVSGCGEAELRLVSEQVKIELGTEPDTMVTTYVNLDEETARETDIDFSAVDVMTVGTYPVTVTYREQTAVFEVVVGDTTAPVVEVAEKVTVTAGSPLYAEDVLTGITELSREVTVMFEAVEPVSGGEAAADGTETAEEPAETAGGMEEHPVAKEYFLLGEVNCNNACIVYPEAGTYENIITVADVSGNSVEVPVHVVVGEAPAIDGVTDMVVKSGEDVDFLEGVTAADCNGNDLTGKLVCDASAVDLEKAGEYEITYTVADENGFTAERKATVTVTEKGQGAGTDSKKETGVSASTVKSETQNNAPASHGMAGNGAASGNSNSNAGGTDGNTTGNGSNTGGNGSGTSTGNSGGSTGGSGSGTSSGNSGGNGGSAGGNSETPSGGASSGSTGGTNETPSGGDSNDTAGNENTGGNTDTPDGGNGGGTSSENQDMLDQTLGSGFEVYDPSTNPDDFNDLGLGEVTWN